MANKYALEWDAQGQKQYEMGVSKGVLYKYNKTSKKWIGTAWNGLISVTENPEGADETERWADNIKYGSLRSAEKFGGSIEAYMYPEEFESCDGLGKPAKGMSISQQKREVFCLCYRTEIGNDQDPEAGYRLHLVYNATCSPSQKQYQTINDSPDAITFSWDFTTTPLNVEGYKPTAHITFDSTDFTTTAEKELLESLEEILYGKAAVTGDNPSEAVPAELPLPDDLIDFMNGD
ncbi:MAG: hypothetical protein IK088_05845 [Lachnospiraceae bacterium]|nr:hypothetical protein [Lachnospiraceae bacterium]